MTDLIEGKLAEFVDRTWGDKLLDDGGCDCADTKARAQMNPVAESRNETTAANDAPDGDWILQKIKDAGVEYVDKRSSGGNLWVIGGSSLQGFVNEMAARGAKFTFAPKGGKVTKHRPAWYISHDATERALKGGK